MIVALILAAYMRNEGIFVLEWLAHHNARGFHEGRLDRGNRPPRKAPA